MRKLSDEEIESEKRDILDEAKWGNKAFEYMRDPDGGKSAYILTYEDRFRSPLKLRTLGDPQETIPFESLEAMLRDGWAVD